MNTRLHRILRRIKTLQPDDTEMHRQTEFDLGLAIAPALTVRLNLAGKNLSQMLDAISAAFASGASELRLELLGPGILLHDHALMLFDELLNRPDDMSLHVHSRTCLADGAILLWLAGDTRSIRCDAWVQLSHMPPLPSMVQGGYIDAVQIVEEDPGNTDLRRIMDYLEEWLPVHEVAGLRLSKDDLEELGLLEDADTRQHLDALLADGPSPNSEGGVSPTPPSTDSPYTQPAPACKTSRDRAR